MLNIAGAAVPGVCCIATRDGPDCPRRRAMRDKPWIFRTYAGHSTAADSNALYRKNLSQGTDRPVGRLRSADPDRLRQRPRAGERRGRQSRRAGQPSRRHARAVRRHPARHDEHLDDHQRHRGVADGALHRGRRRTGRAARQPARHDPERHHQGISVARHLRVSAGAVDAADQGRGDLHHDANCRSGIR